MQNEKPSDGSNGSVQKIGAGAQAPPEVTALAERLGKVHDCPVKLTSEASGYHIYIPCPDCLESHMKGELQDPKYAINASKYLKIGQYRETKPDVSHYYDGDVGGSNEMVGVCMRTRQSKYPHKFRVADLLQMGTVLSRHPEIMNTRFKLIGGGASDDAQSHWEPDPLTGVLCPPAPGEIIPLSQLGDPSHPAIEYLTQRNYDLELLEKQFRCGFCVKEYEHKKNGVFYPAMPGAWRDTPQHRVVFHSLIGGVPMAWQARVLEKLSPDGLQKFMLHPYAQPFRWDLVATRSSHESSWIPVFPFNETDESGSVRFKPSKYRTARFASRELMGWDAAVERAANDPEPLKWVVLCEGPLDAARVGPGGVAMIGSSISPLNLQKVAAKFHIVFTALDTDQAGRLATEKIGKMFYSQDLRDNVVQKVVPLHIVGGKDIGEMSQKDFDEMFSKLRNRVMSQY